MDSLATLMRLGRGQFLDQLGTTLSEVANEVRETGRKGKVTISLDITKSPGEELAVIVMETIKRSPPVDGERGAYFFAFEGELWPSDPRAPEMPLFHEVEPGTGEVRTANDPGKDVRGA